MARVDSLLEGDQLRKRHFAFPLFSLALQRRRYDILRRLVRDWRPTFSDQETQEILDDPTALELVAQNGNGVDLVPIALLALRLDRRAEFALTVRAVENPAAIMGAAVAVPWALDSVLTSMNMLAVPRHRQLIETTIQRRLVVDDFDTVWRIIHHPNFCLTSGSRFRLAFASLLTSDDLLAWFLHAPIAPVGGDTSDEDEEKGTRNDRQLIRELIREMAEEFRKPRHRERHRHRDSDCHCGWSTMAILIMALAEGDYEAPRSVERLGFGILLGQARALRPGLFDKLDSLRDPGNRNSYRERIMPMRRWYRDRTRAEGAVKGRGPDEYQRPDDMLDQALRGPEGLFYLTAPVLATYLDLCETCIYLVWESSRPIRHAALQRIAPLRSLPEDVWLFVIGFIV